MMKTLAMIPARGGSKGLPGKNIKNFLGKPLIAWSIEQALKSEMIDTVAVSTDDEEIARISRDFGADVPELRPPALAADTSPTIDAVIHLLDTYDKKGLHFDVLVLLEPTSPLREKDDLDRALRLFSENYEKADSIVSLGKVGLENPFVMQKIENGQVKSLLDAPKPTRRQEAPEALFPYGVLYATKVAALRELRTFYPPRTMPFFIKRWQNYEIDDLCDFYVCEQVMSKHVEGLL